MSLLLKKKQLLIAALITFGLIIFSSVDYAGGTIPPLHNHYNHREYDPLFAGVVVGYAETDYSAIIAEDPVTQLASIIGADDHGALGGVFVGYQFSPFFIGQFSWVRYPDSKLMLLEPFNFYNISSFWTTTDAYSLILQFLVSIYHTKVKAYSDAGLVLITRNDVLAHISHIGPTFGIGLMYNITRRLLAQFGFVYAAGYGKTIEMPLYKYVPFLLSAQLRIGYRIPL